MAEVIEFPGLRALDGTEACVVVGAWNRSGSSRQRQLVSTMPRKSFGIALAASPEAHGEGLSKGGEGVRGGAGVFPP